MSLPKVEARRTGRSPLARSAANAIRFMSNALVKEMASQCVAKAICNGYNVTVTIPAGPLSADFRKCSIPLLETGAIIRPKNYMGAINSREGALTVIVHHEMVELLIKSQIKMARAKAEERLGNYAKVLSSGLAKSLPAGSAGEVTISFDNLNSVSTIEAKATVEDRTGFATTIDYAVSRDMLALLRRVIAPYYTKQANVVVSLDASGTGPVFLTLNGMNIDPALVSNTVSVTTEDNGSVSAPRTLRSVSGFPSFR